MGMRDRKGAIPVTNAVGGLSRAEAVQSWVKIVDYLKSQPIDSPISFESLSEVLGYNAAMKGRSPINRAWQELEKGGLTLERDGTRGYFLRKM